MRAVFIRSFGGPEKLEVGDVPEPAPGRGEVLVGVKAAALNHLDIWVRGGRPGLALTGPHIMGSDAAGVVEALGEGVKGVRVGTEVVINPGLSCGLCEFCRRGAQSECPEFKLLGFQRPGVYAEKVAVPACNVGLKPRPLSWEEAAALSLAHLTAWHMLYARARYQPGESVLIHGIGGGVALAALQFVCMSGGEAIVTSSSEQKLDRAKALGAAAGVNYKTVDDVGAKVLELTAGRGVDIAFDTVGAPTLPISLATMRRGGRMVTCGITGGREAKVNLQMLYWNHYSLIGSTLGAEEDFRQMLRAVGRTGLKPVMDRTYPLEQYGKAVARMEAGDQFGKITLTL